MLLLRGHLNQALQQGLTRLWCSQRQMKTAGGSAPGSPPTEACTTTFGWNNATLLLAKEPSPLSSPLQKSPFPVAMVWMWLECVFLRAPGLTKPTVRPDRAVQRWGPWNGYSHRGAAIMITSGLIRGTGQKTHRHPGSAAPAS